MGLHKLNECAYSQNGPTLGGPNHHDLIDIILWIRCPWRSLQRPTEESSSGLVCAVSRYLPVQSMCIQIQSVPASAHPMLALVRTRSVPVRPQWGSREALDVNLWTCMQAYFCARDLLACGTHTAGPAVAGGTSFILLPFLSSRSLLHCISNCSSSPVVRSSIGAAGCE